MSFNPLSGGLFGGNSIIDATSLKYRKFLDDDAALRVTLGLNNTSNSYLVAPENSLQELGATGTLTHPDLFLNNDLSSFEIGLGYEKYFDGTDNLLPYIALAVGMSSNSLTLTRERFSALNLDGSTVNSDSGKMSQTPRTGVFGLTPTRLSSTINVDVLFGADYYFNDAIYIGFEAGLRFASDVWNHFDHHGQRQQRLQHLLRWRTADENSSSLVQNTVTGGTGFQWNSATEVNYVINGEPWLGDGVSSSNPSEASRPSSLHCGGCIVE